MGETLKAEELEARLKRQEDEIKTLKDFLKNDKSNQPEKRSWSLGLSDEEDEVDDADKLLNDTSKDDDENMNQIEEMLSDIEKAADLGPEISSNVAESFLKTVARPLSKESKIKLKQLVKIPSNCKLLNPPKVNAEIWKIIPPHARLQDVKQQQNQQALSVGLSALAMITNEILSKKSEIPKDVVSSIVRMSMDSANIMGDQCQLINTSRKLELKRFLNPEYSEICTTQVVQSEWLFGNDLSESLKASKATSNLVRSTAARGHRYQPYTRQTVTRPSFNGPLNYSRPFRGYQRGNGLFRQTNFRQSSNFQNPMWKSNQSTRGSRH